MHKIYFGDTGHDKIRRCDLDGSNIENLITTGLNRPNGIALDLTNNKMYWVEGATQYSAKIRRADLKRDSRGISIF